MRKYRITEQGISKEIEYRYDNTNRVKMEKKLLALLKRGIGYSADSLYKGVTSDPAVNTRNVSRGSIEAKLQEMEAAGYAAHYDDDSYGADTY